MPLYSRPPTRTVPSLQKMLSSGASTDGPCVAARVRSVREGSSASPGRKLSR